MALRQGLEALSQGLLRQMEIGGVAYKDATVKEAEKRAETRSMAAERRAKTELLAAEARLERTRIRAEGRQEEITKRHETRAATTFTQRLGEEGTARLEIKEEELKLLQTQWKKQYDIQETAKKAAGKLTKQHDVLKSKYEEDASTAKGLMESWIESNTDMNSPQYLKAWRAEQNALGSWNAYATSAGFTIGPPAEFKRLLLRTAEAVHAEVAQSMRGDEEWDDFVKALQQEKGGALEDAEQTISDAIKDLGITLPKDERQKMVTLVIESFVTSPNIRKGTVEIGDPDPDPVDHGDGDVRFRHQAGDPLDRIDEENLEVGAFKRALAAQGGPGKSGPRGTEGAQWRDPEWLLPRLEFELTRLIRQRDAPSKGGAGGGVRKSPAFLQKITRVEALILKMKTLLGDDKSDASLMMVPQRGMIAAVDQGIPAEALAYWEPDVADARAKAMQQQRTA